MSDPQRIFELLEDMLELGSTPEEACADCPELLPLVRERLTRLHEVKSSLNFIFPDNPPPGETEDIWSQRPWRGPPQIPGYEVREVLGRGATGIVYKATHLKLHRPVALKMLLSGAYASESERKRLLREAESIASLRHPNLVQIYDVGDFEGCPYFTMEFIEAGTLAQQLAGVPLAPARAAALLKVVADGVQTAHSGGIIHRDLKPSNILLTDDGTPKISDFGLARRSDSGEDLTRSGERVGTPCYMSPEQATNRTGEVGLTTDIYSLGAILYEMLTGRPPFLADTTVDTERQLIADEPVRPSRLNSKVPRDLETICLKCLQKDSNRRYATAGMLSADLQRFLKGEPIAARPVGTIGRTLKWAHRRPAVAGLSSATILLALGFAGGSIWIFSQQRARTHAVEKELANIVALERQGRWADARTAVLRGRAELGGHGPLDLGRHLDDRDRELDLVEKLEDIPFNQASFSPERPAELGSEFRSAFESYGIHVFGPDTISVVAEIKASPIRLAILDTFDGWLSVTGGIDQRNWLLQVARASDEDQTPWKRAARDPQTWDDKSAFDRAISAAPISERSVPILLSLSWRAQSFNEDRVPLLTKIQQKYPGNLAANLDLGFVYYRQNNGAEALRYFQAAASSQPRKAIAECDLASMLYLADRKEEAIVHFQNAIALQPSVTWCYVNYANALVDLGRYAEALQQLELALKLNPRLKHAYFDIGHCYDLMGESQKATQAYREGLELQPTLVVKSYRSRPALSGVEAWEKSWPHLRDSFFTGPVDFATGHEFLELCLFLGHDDEYRDGRSLLLEHASEITDPHVAERTGRACLLKPASDKETRAAAMLIDRAMSAAASKDQAWARNYFLVSKALLELRLGNPQDVPDILQGGPSKVLRPMPQMILAMAQQRLGKTVDARKTLALALGMFDWNRNRAIEPDDWMFHALRQQAEAMIQEGWPQRCH
jgi:serine/threonine-protein kinase